MKADPASTAYIGLGGNEGDVEITLAEALWAIDALPQTSIRKQSAFYRCPAWGVTDQADFLNAVVAVQTRLTPRILLDQLLEIERRFGRERSAETRWGPRTLDLDLLLYDDLCQSEHGLTLPHPHMHERGFVIVPLLEISPDLVHPQRGAFAGLLAALDVSGITVLE